MAGTKEVSNQQRERHRLPVESTTFCFTPTQMKDDKGYSPGTDTHTHTHFTSSSATVTRDILEDFLDIESKGESQTVGVPFRAPHSRWSKLVASLLHRNTHAHSARKRKVFFYSQPEFLFVRDKGYFPARFTCPN